MRTEDFPLCCGAMVLGDFGYTNITGGHYGAINGDPTWMHRKLPPKPDEIRIWVEQQIADHKDYAILCVTLNEEQNTSIGQIFTNLGFKLVSQGLNSHHNGMVYLYTLCNTEFFSYEDDWSDEEVNLEEKEQF